uniref:Uncharacterized protein n=1 Tax=Pyricularia oryzae (strain P131) TaxID=1143193 RepID=L7JLD3_PYRO1
MAPDSIKGPLGIDERRMLVFAHQCGGPDGSLFALLRYTYKFVQVQRRPQGYRCYKSKKEPRRSSCCLLAEQGPGPGPWPANAKFAAIRRCLRGLLISYPPYHMCINTVLGQVMFQIAGFESHGSSQSHIIDNLG